MTPESLAAIIALAEKGVVAAIALYRIIEENNAGVKPLAEVLADADATFDHMIATAQGEIDAPPGVGIK